MFTQCPFKSKAYSLHKDHWLDGAKTFPITYRLSLKVMITLMIAATLIAATITIYEVYASIENGILTDDIKSLLHNTLDGKLGRLTISGAALLASLIFTVHLIRDKHFGFASFCILWSCLGYVVKEITPLILKILVDITL